METVSFDVEWLSEDQFRMTYDDKNDEFDEEYVITMPQSMPKGKFEAPNHILAAGDGANMADNPLCFYRKHSGFFIFLKRRAKLLRRA